MNRYVEERYDEQIERLVLGIEPRDAKRNLRIAHRIDVVIEGPPLTAALKQSLLDRKRVLSDAMRCVPRHASCRYVVTYRLPLEPSITLRFLDRWQRFVPRRLTVPLVTLVHPDKPEELDTVEYPPTVPAATPQGFLRTRRPRLFPGAAYDVSEQSTGLRGRAVRADAKDPTVFHPARWARVQAIAGDGTVVGTAHADHKGEFLLLLDSVAAVELVDRMASVTVSAPRNALVPVSDLDAAVDPLWDLPLETLAAPGVTPDGVADGTTLPGGYNGSATQQVQFTYGVLRSLGVLPFQIQ